MAVNLNTNSCMNLDEPVTSSELRAARANQESLQDEIGSQKSEEKRPDGNAVRIASDFSKNKSIMRRHKSRKKKKELEKKRKEQQAREQVLQNGRVRKYTGEMRNREVIRKNAIELQKKALVTSSTKDDAFVVSVLSSERCLDKLVYNTTTSDVEGCFDDIADDIISDMD